MASSTSGISPGDVQMGIMPTALNSREAPSGNLSGREAANRTGIDCLSINIPNNISPEELENNPQVLERLKRMIAKVESRSAPAPSTPVQPVATQPTPAQSTAARPTTAQSTTNPCFCYECNNSCCQCLDIICCTQDINPPPCYPPSPACCAYAIGFPSSCCQKVICLFATGVITLASLYIAQGKMGV